MESYLRDCKEKLKNIKGDESVIIVLGNESCDLDSAVSSLVLAFHLSESNRQDLVLPVLNVKRENLKLHTEVAFFLETCLNLDDIICKEDIDIKKFVHENRLKVVLVDHNVLSDEDSFLEPLVIQIIDHHAVENLSKIESIPHEIEPVGSCCTLIAQKLLTANHPFTDSQIAMLLYGTILLDTVCLNEKAKRCTEKDKEIVSKLESLLPGVDREEVFQNLQKAKFDVSGYSPRELLQKDLKVVSHGSSSIAISSIPMLLKDIENGASIATTLTKFSCDNNYKAVVLMGSQISEDSKSIQREIALFSDDEKLLKNLCDFLVNLKDPSLELESSGSSTSNFVSFEQKNVTLSRKFVLPAVRQFLHQQGSESLTSEKASLNDLNNDLQNLESQDSLVGIYQAETLDVPDSPSHTSLLEISMPSKENFETELVSSVETPYLDKLKNMQAGDTDSIGSARKKISVHITDLQSDSVNDDQKSLSSLSNKSDTDVFSPADEDDVLADDDDTETPEELENSDMSAGIKSSMSEPIAEISAAEELEEERSWKTVIVNEEERKIDMRVIDPYKKVLSHGGYEGDTRNAIIIFSACFLPNRSRKDYDYVMDNLFLYVLSTLDHLVAESYILVYLHGATERGSMPSFGWLKRCYLMIDRRLRKNLKGLYLVHPTFWLKTIVIMTRPFISSKFSRKLKFVYDLDELSTLVPINDVCIPEKVKLFDEKLLDS